MSYVFHSQTTVRPQTTPCPTAAHAAEADSLLREMAYVFHLTERVRKAIAAGEELLPAGA